jgi:hypothetical protein
LKSISAHDTKNDCHPLILDVSVSHAPVCGYGCAAKCPVMTELQKGESKTQKERRMEDWNRPRSSIGTGREVAEMNGRVDE